MTAKHKHNNHSHHTYHSNFDLYDDVEKIKDALLNATYDIKGKAAELFTQSLDQAKEQSDKLKDNVVEYTSDKPFKSLGIALLSGIAIGYFLRK